MNKFLLGFLLTISTFAHATCDDHFAAGAPIIKGQPTTQLCRIGYVAEHLDACKAPLLVMEHLLGSNVGGVEPRQGFRPDSTLPVGKRAVNKDYAKSGYDMGHMAPAADFTTDAATMAQSFYLSNAVPQNPNLNRGTWKALETRIRGLAMKYGDIYVYTGAVFGNATIGSGVCVPTHMYKVLINVHNKETIAYLLPNEPKAGKYQKYATTVSEIERFTGIDFFPDLPTEIKTSQGASFK